MNELIVFLLAVATVGPGALLTGCYVTIRIRNYRIHKAANTSVAVVQEKSHWPAASQGRHSTAA